MTGGADCRAGALHFATELAGAAACVATARLTHVALGADARCLPARYAVAERRGSGAQDAAAAAVVDVVGGIDARAVAAREAESAIGCAARAASRARRATDGDTAGAANPSAAMSR